MMAKRGWTEPDSTGYGYASVRLKESLRQEIAPVPTSVADSLMKQTNDDDDDTPTIFPAQTQPKPVEKPGFFKRLFGKKILLLLKKKNWKLIL